MSRLFDYYSLVVGRILVGAYFLWSGILLATNLQASAAEFGAVHAGIDPLVLAVLAAAIQALGGIAVIASWKVRYASLVIALYVIVSTFVFGAAVPDSATASLFVKNMAIVGALLYISATAG